MKEWKKPSGTVCLLAVLLLVLIMSILLVIVQKITLLVHPLGRDARDQIECCIVESQYINLDVIDKGNTYVIYRDTNTDVLYLELRSNSYSSALTPMFNADGTLKKYNQDNQG